MSARSSTASRTSATWRPMPWALALPRSRSPASGILNREEILATAGVNGRASLLFFDVADARARLLTDPWIGEATVQKLLPNRLMIAIVEREPFALWQKDGRVSVDRRSTVPCSSPMRCAAMSAFRFLVGAGADDRAKDFLAKLDRHPELRANVRARY